MDDNDATPWRCGDPWKNPVPKPMHHWKKCHDFVQKHDEEMCDVWKDEVDKLLIFAGLFSATVTAFTIESYKWLEQDPEDNLSRLLVHITLQLSQGFPNATALPTVDYTTSSVSASAVRINIFWFLSLALSMATVLVGILCMQWLHEFQRDAARSHRGAVAMRQMRFEGLVAWKVPEMLSALPLLLQSALVLFFAGVLDLLWDRNPVVAAIVTTVVGVIFSFLIITTALPTLQFLLASDAHLRVGQCPYKSPQSWALYMFTTGAYTRLEFLHKKYSPILFRTQSPAEQRELEHGLWDPTLLDVDKKDWNPLRSPSLSRFSKFLGFVRATSWINYDILWRYLRDALYTDQRGRPRELEDSEDSDLVRGLTWIDHRFTENVELVHSLYYCLVDMDTAQASQVVSALDPYVGFLPHVLFPDSRDIKRRHPMALATDREKKEYVCAVYLWLHKHVHPDLNRFYLESVIRLINTDTRCAPYIVLRGTDQDLRGLPDETLLQLFTSLKEIISQKTATLQQALDIWKFIHDLCFLERPITDQLFAIVFASLEEFKHWLDPNEKNYLATRMEICAIGIIGLFAFLDQTSMETIQQSIPLFQTAEDLVGMLDFHINGPLQEKSAILRGLSKCRWPKTMKKLYPDLSDFSINDVKTLNESTTVGDY